ncbi:MAG: HAD family acid phosphatase [Acidobacteriota bacterium]
MKRFLTLVLLVSCWPVCAQQAVVTVPGEPTNLDVVKKQLLHYQACTEAECYVPQIERQVDLAMGFLQESVAKAQKGEKLAIVLDIDETSLSNWSVEVHDDFGYIPNDSNWCVALRCGIAIAGTLRLYREAEKDGVTVFFITGRPETQRVDTEANLRAVGYDQWGMVYLRPVDHPKGQTVSDYKSGDRAEIMKMGYRIVLNVGDQLSDLAGEPQAEHSVKLPNPFYFIG